MIILIGNSYRPGTVKYKEALGLIGNLKLDMTEVAIVDSKVDNLEELVKLSTINRTIRLIAVGTAVSNRLKNTKCFPLPRLTEIEVKRCKKWLQQTSST